MAGLLLEIADELAKNGFEKPENAPEEAVYKALAAAVMRRAKPAWDAKKSGKTACYFSAEFLLGRLLEANLLNLGLLEEGQEALKKLGFGPFFFDAASDAALGNGGLGRLAACFLDSGASCNYRLNGYGIRYKYGLFKQKITDGFQVEEADEWQTFGDFFSLRRDGEKVLVHFADGPVFAVPYDMPVIGFGGATVNTLRLWQAEAKAPPDFAAFNRHNYAAAYSAQNSANALCAFLYPADESEEGKVLRLRQQYFFSSASVQSILQKFKKEQGGNFALLPQQCAIQLNDTHPTVAIPELIRLLMENEELGFEAAFEIAQKTFAYTNHTLMAEALEAWDENLFACTLPKVWPYVVMLQNHLRAELAKNKIEKSQWHKFDIVSCGRVHMAHMAIFATHSTNGVAKLHTELLKTKALPQWHSLYPQRFNNKTNGVTQRRWLKLCNPGLADIVGQVCGPAWVQNAQLLEKLKPHVADAGIIESFVRCKNANKSALADSIKTHTGISVDPASVYSIQIKRLHEYKRQLLNAFSVLDLYYGIKEGRLKNLPPSTFLFGGKAAAGYRRAKAIIKYINQVAGLVNGDKSLHGALKVVFVPDYNVSWAQRLIPAADISEQISTAGTEASGTGNMKFAMNGAVTLGTWDGANIEIFEAAGPLNNYVFGARVEELAVLSQSYEPAAFCKENPRLARAVNSLVDGSLSDGGTGDFKELHTSLMQGASWHRADQYFLLKDFESYTQAKLQAIGDWENTENFAQKCLYNIAASGIFSSDRTINQYAKEIWQLE